MFLHKVKEAYLVFLFIKIPLLKLKCSYKCSLTALQCMLV